MVFKGMNRYRQTNLGDTFQRSLKQVTDVNFLDFSNAVPSVATVLDFIQTVWIFDP